MTELSMRKYSEMLGCDHKSVSNAVKNGEINEGYNPQTKKIIVAAANMEWGADFMQRNANKKLAAFKVKTMPPDLDDDELEDCESDIKQSTGYVELQRLELLHKTRLAKQKYDKEAGTLVNKDDVYREMFEYGKNIRLRLQAIPDRIIDELLSADRDAAKLLLTNEITDALEDLSKYEHDTD